MSGGIVLGWEEWLALPELGLPAIKAKIDTGARTSALHAVDIEPVGTPAKPQVRFGVHPIPGRDDVTVTCVADVIDRREVTSSNGDREVRYVIRTPVEIGGRQWPIEVTLTNRVAMAYRMLLGRQAIQDDTVVDPTASFVQPKLSYKVYSRAVREPAGERRRLTIALMTRRPDNITNRRLVRMAEARGHRIEIIDRARVSLYIDASEPAFYVDGRSLTGIDALIVRAGRSLTPFSIAAARQLEILGSWSLTSADALARLSDPLALRQTLARAGIAVPEAAVSAGAAGGETHRLADSRDAFATSPVLRFAVLAGRALAAVERDAPSALDVSPPWRRASPGPGHDAARALAERAASVLSLGLAAVDVAPSRLGPVVIDVAPSVQIAQVERLTGAAIIEAVIVHIEQACRTRPAAG